MSSRALREIGEAREWYEARSPGLGEEVLTAVELQLKRLEQMPLLYTEKVAGIVAGFTASEVINAGRQVIDTWVGY